METSSIITLQAYGNPLNKTFRRACEKGYLRCPFSLFADFITCSNLVIVEKGLMQFEYASNIALVAVSLACTFSSVTALPRPDQVDNPDNLKYIVPDPVAVSYTHLTLPTILRV